MSKTLPAAASKANSDASTDDPKQALLTDLADLIDKFNTLRTALGPLALMGIGGALEQETDADAGDPDLLRVALKKRDITIDDTAVASDRGKVLNFSAIAASKTLAFTAAATLGDGWWCLVRPGTSFNLTLNPDGSELIDGATTVIVPASASGFIVSCDGAAFKTHGLGAKQLWQIAEKTGAYPVTLADWFAIIEATAGTWTLSLPALATMPDGFVFGFKNSGSGVVTSDGNSAETVDGAATKAFAQNSSAFFLKKSSGWITMGGTPAAPIFTASYASAQQTVADNGLLSLTHGLGAAPKLIACKLICTDAGGDLGYAQNDEVHIASGWSGTLNQGHQIYATATQIFVRYGNSTGANLGPYSILNKSGSGAGVITTSKWALVVLAYA